MTTEFLHRKERVILTAIDIIDELGIQGLSTKEIAKRQKISEGTLFRHFRSKTEIIAAVLDYYSKYDADIFQSIKLKKLSSKEAILYVIEAFATYYENYPAITAIMQLYSVLSYDAVLAEKIKTITSSRVNLMREVIKEGQLTGQIKPDVDGELLVEILNGTFAWSCLRWRLSGYSFPLRERMISVAQTVMDAFKLQN
jgi:AcrR family transcriptional regulator